MLNGGLGEGALRVMEHIMNAAMLLLYVLPNYPSLPTRNTFIEKNLLRRNF